MPALAVNGVALTYDVAGARDAPGLVLVHGSWGDRHDWDRVVPLFAADFRVVAYSRRGHDAGRRRPERGSIHDDAADLAALIRRLGLAPAHVVGNSFGASVALRLAGARSALFRSLSAHEPPLLGLLADDPATAPTHADMRRRLDAVAERLRGGDLPGGAELFVNSVVGGPGRWERLPPEARRTLIQNAPTFLDEWDDPDSYTADPREIARYPGPALLTHGDQSPPFFAMALAKVAEALPQAHAYTFAGAGHVPHTTRPADYVATLTAFMRDNQPGG